MQSVNLVRVFIASPSDVNPERDAAVTVTQEWNAAYSFQQRVAIEAVRMETHAQAALGCHPQELVNGQLLGRCDFLVAIFWSRLGSPTPEAASGTVHEIDEFSRLKGPHNVLLFFAERGYPNDVDVQEVERLRAFKEQMRDKGLFLSYSDLDGFRRLLRQQLDMRLQQFVTLRGVFVTHGAPLVALESDGAGTRIDEFRALRAKAGRSMYVMGIGLSYFSADVTLMRSLLRRGLSVRLLMIDPDVIATSRASRSRKGAPPVSIMAEALCSYFSRAGYQNDIRSSLERLKEIVKEAGASQEPGSGSVELRMYPHFIPMNFTAIDEALDGKVLLEFCLPFSDQRLRMLIAASCDRDLFTQVMDNAERLWTKATRVLSSSGTRKQA